MAASVVEIVNMALVYIGATSIVSMNDSKKSAITATVLWPGARDAVLRAYPWNCAVARKVLAPEATPPAFDWAHSFVLPPECLRILSVKDDIEYCLEGRRILTNSTVVYIKYIQRVEDVTQYDPLLCQAMAAHLAQLLAMPIVQSATLEQAMQNRYKLFLQEARSVDAQESSLQELQADAWLESRL